jgi:hypothetical protein
VNTLEYKLKPEDGGQLNIFQEGQGGIAFRVEGGREGGVLRG